MSILPKFEDENLTIEVEEDEPPTPTIEEDEEVEENEGAEQSEEEPEQVEVKEEKPKEELFDMPNYDEEPAVKTKKKRKPLSEETKAKLRASLAKAREKSKEKRAALKEMRAKKAAEEKPVKKKHIRERKARKMAEEAELEVMAETNIMKKEQDLWNEERITSLMNRTLDTYFTKRQEEKKKREKFPMPAQQTNEYYVPHYPAHNQQGYRAVPKPSPQPPKPRKATNPYADLFGLTQDDYDDYYRNK